MIRGDILASRPPDPERFYYDKVAVFDNLFAGRCNKLILLATSMRYMTETIEHAPLQTINDKLWGK